MIFFIASAILAVSGSIWIVYLYYTNTVPTPIRGGTYTEGMVGQPVAINPLISSENEADRDLMTLTFASLADLAETIKMDDTKKIWTITLRPELKWSDEEPLTSDDVVFTLGVLQDSENRSWQGVSVERLSEREFRFNLKNPYAFFADNLKNLLVAPQHIFDNIPPQNYRLSNFNLEPVGSGPYKYAGYEKRADGFIDKYYLVINPFYALEKPLIKNFNFRFFPSRKDALEAFDRRGIDGLGGLDYAEAESLKISHQVLEADLPRYYAIFFNQSLHAALKEKEIRAALDASIDRARILKEIFKDNAVRVDGPIPPIVAGYDPEIYDDAKPTIDQIKASLDKAGWKADDTGLRSKVISKNKVILEFEMVIPDAKFLTDTANLIKEDWLKIGVVLKPVILKSSEVRDVIKTRNYKMVIFGNILHNGNPDLFDFWHSSKRFDPGLNLALYSDKVMDTLLESVRQNFDETARQTDLFKIQTLIYQQKPASFLFSPKYFYAAPQNLGGFSAKLITTSANRFENINHWYLKTARVFK
ncbi:MAG: Uncharacterized protein G01um10143_228 [Parcubacteria group bacterium Gr01-1014_3]|nr:MAG: Uncharacterized protein G01um10143_228 [Parcubacteria group bacterium Gr01-1014_3]